MYANDTMLLCNFNTTCNSGKTNSEYIHGNSLWKYYVFYVTLRTSLPVRRVWKISNVTQNNLLPFIHNCHPIEETLEKSCIKFVWSLYNSNYALYSNRLRFSLKR